MNANGSSQNFLWTHMKFKNWLKKDMVTVWQQVVANLMQMRFYSFGDNSRKNGIAEVKCLSFQIRQISRVETLQAQG
jgi:hypothetical protein